MFFIVAVFLAVTAPVSADGPNAYMEKDLYCLEVGWDETSQEYFNTHHLDCKFINVLKNGTYVLDMHAQIPQVGDICHEIHETPGEPPTFTHEDCVYTEVDWVAAGSPSEYVIEGQGCMANFLFFINEGLGFDDTVWGKSPVVTFTPSGNIKSTCVGIEQ